MGTRFTRVTVIGESRQVDVSLPADEPLSGQLPTVLRLLAMPTGREAIRWVLSTTATGAIPRDHSLDDAGVLDGTVLHLTPAAEAPPPPFVDDVEAAAADQVTAIAPAWAEHARRSGIAIAVTLVLALALIGCATAGSPVSWAGAAVTALAALAIAAVISEPGGATVAVLAAPAAALVALGLAAGSSGPNGAGLAEGAGPTPLATLLSGGWHGAAAPLAATAAAVGLLAAGLVRRWPGLRVAGVTGIVLAGTATLAVRLGLPADRTAGLVLLLAVIGIGLAGQAALGGAGLVNLMRFDEDGTRVPQVAVQRAVRRGQSVATGLVWCCAVLAALALWVLAAGAGTGAPEWINRVVAAVGGLIFAVRSRMFTRARQVLPMLLTATVGAAAIALSAPGWLGMSGRAAALMGLVLLAVVVLVLVATGLSALPEVPRARMRRMLDRVDSLAVLALVPLLILLFATIPAMQRWLG